MQIGGDILWKGREPQTWRKAVGYEKITVNSSVKTLTAASYANAYAAFIMVEDNHIRYTEDGTTPSKAAASQNGIMIMVGQYKWLEGQDKLANVQMTREQSSDATVHVIYYK